MNRLTFSILAIFLILNVGCTTVGQMAGARQGIPFHAFPSEGKPAIYLWPPYTSAAIVDTEGNRCVLAASGAQTVNANSEAALKVGDLFKKIADLDASTKNTLVEAFARISAADSRAAFVDVSLFHLCILDQNGTLQKGNEKGQMVIDAYLKTIDAARSLIIDTKGAIK